MAHTFRPSWSGSIRLSLVSVPVKGFTALESEKARISLNQLHEECHSRIKYKKTCPIHGEVPNDEIVMGYQYGQDQYAIIDPDEVNKLRSEAERAVTIDRFVSPDQIDPIYYSGQTYYLMPDGKQGQKAYSVLQKAMQAEKVVGIAQVVISNREQLVVLRPVGRLLTVSVLHYDASIRPAAAFDANLEKTEVLPQELKLAKTLIEATQADDPELDTYKNLYNDRLQELVEAKIAGEEIATPPAESQGPPVVNFLDALKASLEKKKPRTPGSKKPLSPRRPRAAAKRRKSG
jgi:DNA end-binding protein Ku